MKQSDRFYKALHDYGTSLARRRGPDQWDVRKFDNTEFFYGVMFDQGIRADLAWNAPTGTEKASSSPQPAKNGWDERKHPCESNALPKVTPPISAKDAQLDHRG